MEELKRCIETWLKDMEDDLKIMDCINRMCDSYTINVITNLENVISDDKMISAIATAMHIDYSNDKFIVYDNKADSLYTVINMRTFVEADISQIADDILEAVTRGSNSFIPENIYFEIKQINKVEYQKKLETFYKKDIDDLVLNKWSDKDFMYVVNTCTEYQIVTNQSGNFDYVTHEWNDYKKLAKAITLGGHIYPDDKFILYNNKDGNILMTFSDIKKAYDCLNSIYDYVVNDISFIKDICDSCGEIKAYLPEELFIKMCHLS